MAGRVDGGINLFERNIDMSGKKTGEGYWQIDNPDDEAAKARYRQAIVESLSMFESAIKLIVRAHDRAGLQSVRYEVEQMFKKAELTMRKQQHGMNHLDTEGK